MARQDHTPVTDEEKQHFLDQLANGASIVEAAGDEAMRRKFYRRIDPEETCYDEDFAKAWAETIKLHRRDYLVHVAQTRAVNGWAEPVFYKGETVGTITRIDNQLLMFLIKQADPSYRDRVAIEGAGDGAPPVQVEVKHSVDDLAAVASILAGAGALRADGGADS